MKNDDSFRGVWHNINHTNIHIIGVPEREERKHGIENLFEEIITENFLNLVKEKYHTSPGSTEYDLHQPKRPAPRHNIVKMPKFKDKERILKAARDQQLVT